jgi:hypothetical protein
VLRPMTEFLSPPFFVRGLLVLVCAGRSFSGDCSGARLVTTLGERYAYGVTLQAGDFSLPIDHLHARYLRAKFQVTNAPACDWVVSVRDQALRPVQTFRLKDLGPPGIAWTARVRGEHLRLDVTACADGRVPALTALAYIELHLRAAIRAGRSHYGAGRCKAAGRQRGHADGKLRHSVLGLLRRAPD